jgi:hypothetical protein
MFCSIPVPDAPRRLNVLWNADGDAGASDGANWRGERRDHEIERAVELRESGSGIAIASAAMCKRQFEPLGRLPATWRQGRLACVSYDNCVGRREKLLFWDRSKADMVRRPI